MHKNNWVHKGTVADGDSFIIDKLNIWDHDWKSTGKEIFVNDPLYNQPYRLLIYTIEANGKVIKFAAGEFSNMVFGIYQEE
jgi:hypothetical protein